MNELDLNFYFRDMFGRLCVLATAGGLTPSSLQQESSFSSNAVINKLVHQTAPSFKVMRNPILSSILDVQYPNIDLEHEMLEYLTNENYSFSSQYNINLTQLPNIINFQYHSSDDKFEDYFRNFDELAKRGVYVYDKLNINLPGNDEFVLVSYPIYDKKNEITNLFYKEFSQIFKETISIKKSLITKKNKKFYKSNFKIQNLINIIDSL